MTLFEKTLKYKVLNPLPRIPMGILYGKFGDGELGGDWWIKQHKDWREKAIKEATEKGLVIIYEDTDSIPFGPKETDNIQGT